jgi:LysR family cyn operon transcriptional activator
MELRHLRYFIRVAELLHFSRAAESLYVSQPTLSVHIQKLEEEIGAPLFDRGRNLRLTESGQLFLARARNALRQLEQGKEEIADLHGLLRGSLSVGVSYAFLADVPAMFTAYKTAHPEIHVCVRMGTALDIEQAILDRTVDVGISFLPPESDDIDSETLFADDIVLVVSKNHPLANITALPLPELNDLPVVLPSTLSLRRFIDAHFAKEKIFPKVVLEINDVSALLSIVETGIAAAITSRWAASSRPGLHVISLCGTGLARSVGIVRHRSVPLSAAARAFVELARAKLRL